MDNCNLKSYLEGMATYELQQATRFISDIRP